MALASALVRKLMRDDSLAIVLDMAVSPDLMMRILYVIFTHTEKYEPSRGDVPVTMRPCSSRALRRADSKRHGRCHDRSRNAHCRAVAPFLYENFHDACLTQFDWSAV
jgi:hypothetical protein